MFSSTIRRHDSIFLSGPFLSVFLCFAVLLLLPGQLLAQDFWKSSPYRKQATVALIAAQQSPFIVLADQMQRLTRAQETREAKERFEQFWIKHFEIRSRLAGAQLVSWRNPYTLLAHRIYGKQMITWGLEIPKEPKKYKPLDWFQSPHTPAVAAAQMVGLQNPYELAAAKQFGSYRFVWGPEVMPRGTFAPPLHPDWLNMIEDDIGFPDLSERIREEWSKQEVVEFSLFLQALYNAKFADTKAFANSAGLLEKEKIGWAHLYNDQRKQYRGKVIPLEGELLRLRKIETPFQARPIGRPQVEWFYEGWVQTGGDTPVCVLFTDLPKGVEPNEIAKQHRFIRFNGYYLKRHRYPVGKNPDPKARDKYIWRLAPFMIAPTFTVTTAPVAEPVQDVPLRKLVWNQSQYTPAVATAQLVGLQNPYVVASARQLGSYRFVWGPEILPKGKYAPPLNPEWLEMAMDDKEFPNLAIKPIREEWKEQEVVELNLFTQALYNAKFTDEKAFANSAKLMEDYNIGWPHLYGKQRKQYRGKVIPLNGKLLRIRKYESPLAARPIGRPQVRWYYEGWVQTETDDATPVCVIFAELPEGVKPFEKPNGDPLNIHFDGYYLKRYVYQITKRNQDPKIAPKTVWRATPYLVAPTFEFTESPPLRTGIINQIISGGALLFLVAIGAFVALFLANSWLRSGDAKVRARISAIKEQKFPTNLENVGTEAGSAASKENEGGYFTNLVDEPLEDTEDYSDNSSNEEDLLLAPKKPRFQFPQDSEDG